VKTKEKVIDYRTRVSGITPKLLANGKSFEEVQKRVADLLEGRYLIGHAIHNDLQVLFLSHPHLMIRDTTKYLPFRQHVGGSTPSLRKLAETELGLIIQTGEHSSVTDAKITMLLYRKVRNSWEKSIVTKTKAKMKRRNRAIASSNKRLLKITPKA
jgi:RNA exonuclease 4